MNKFDGRRPEMDTQAFACSLFVLIRF